MNAKRVLVVDDALVIRQRIIEIAKLSGWEIAGQASNGKQAVEMYFSQRPDLVTLDIVMPEMDGVESLKEIRSRDPEARVVMVTAINQKEKLAECIQAGAIDFIVKPFDKATLIRFFEKALSS